MAERERTCACACGQLRIIVRGAPRRVYACHCLDCQAATGTAFAYRVIFATEAVIAEEGTARRWRRTGSSGRWVEQAFCPVCGSIVWMTAEGLTDAVALSVGGFRDPDFPPPAAAHWTSRRPGWVSLAGAADAS